MLRTLFLQELRRSWLAHTGLFAAVFGTAALVVRFASRESPLSPVEESFLGGLLFGGLLLSGLISGERCFPAAFKEGRYAFFLTFPRSRGGIWLALLGSRLIGALAALPVPLLIGPPLLFRWLATRSWPFLIAAISIYLVYFLGSAALALALRKEVLVYLVGFPLFTGVLALLASYASYGFLPIPAYLQQSSHYLKSLFCVSLLLALVWAVTSLRAFCRGEIHLGRRTARTLVEGGLASAALLGLALIAFSSSTLAAIGEEWSPAALPYQDDSRPISADGRFLFIQQRNWGRPLFTRLAVVDLESGSTTHWLERPEIYQTSWSASEAVLNVLAANGTPLDCLGIPCQRSTSWYRLSPDLHVLSIRKFPGTGFIRHFGNGLLLVTRQGSTGRIYRLSDRDGSFAEILSRELDDDPRAWSLDGGAVVVFPTTASLLAWWLDSQGRVRHEDSMNPKLGQPYYFVGRRILLRDGVLAEAVQRDFPLRSSKPENWDLLLPDTGGPLDLGSGRFYVERHMEMGFIWWHDAEHGTWIRIPAELRMVDFNKLTLMRSLPPLKAIEYEGSGLSLARIDFDSRTGILAAAIPIKGRRQLVLYDGRLSRSIPTTVACNPHEEGMIGLQQVQGLKGLLVRFTCSDQTGFRRYRLLEIVPGSGRVRDLPWHSTVDQSGFLNQWVYLNPAGISIWKSGTGEVWQASPGGKRLRLNPPM